MLKLTKPTVLIIDVLNKIGDKSDPPSKKQVDEAIDYCIKYDLIINKHLRYILWGIYLNKIGEYRNAITKFEEAIKINPNAGYAYLNLGIAYDALGQYELANDKKEKSECIRRSDFDFFC